MALHPLLIGDLPAATPLPPRDCAPTSTLTRVLNLTLIPADEDNVAGLEEHRDLVLVLRGEAVREAGGLRECLARLRAAGYQIACAPGVTLDASQSVEGDRAAFDELSRSR